MAIFEFPVISNIANYSFNIDIEDTTYNFQFSYNAKLDKWIMNIFDIDNNPLLIGNALVLGINYLNYSYNSNLPQGFIVLNNFFDTNQECGRNDLGNNCTIAFATLEDLNG